MENIEEAFDRDISSQNSQGAEAVESIKMNERRGNVYENKGSAFSSPRRSGNVIENTASYALKAGMLVKRKVVSL
jgi:hypothetical protein